MSTPTVPPDLKQLTDTVNRLAETLARSERRYAHLVRLVRWSSLAMVCVITVAAVLISDMSGPARAENQQVSEKTDGIVEALNTLNQNLAIFGMAGNLLKDVSTQERIGQVKTAMQSTIGNALQRDAAVTNDFLSFLLETKKIQMTNPPPPREWAKTLSDKEKSAYLKQYGQRPEIISEYMVNRTTGTLIDAVVLVTRIRQDSNQFRQWLEGEGIKPVLKGIAGELNLMNRALLSVPVMAAQMDAMNRNISSMTYSMGSTMGRMGSWMPW